MVATTTAAREALPPGATGSVLRTLVARASVITLMPHIFHWTEVGLEKRRGVSAPPGGILSLRRRAKIAFILAPLPSAAPTCLMAVARLIETATLHPWPIFMPAVAVLTAAAHEDASFTGLRAGSSGMSLIPPFVSAPALTVRTVLIATRVTAPALTLRALLRPGLAIAPTGLAPPGFMTQTLIGIKRLLFS